MALGKIKADTLEHSTAGSVDTQFVVNGSAKAWSQSQMYTSNLINDSLNHSSLTDEAAGDFTLTVTSAFGNAKFCISASTSTGHSLQDRSTRDEAHDNRRTTSTQRVKTEDDGTTQDCNHNCVSFHGDLA